MPHKGYDVFFVTPGSTASMTCVVCGRTLAPERDQVGPMSMADAVGNYKRPHDLFQCPSADDPWHRQALELVLAIEQMPSKRVADLMKQDLADLLTNHAEH